MKKIFKTLLILFLLLAVPLASYWVYLKYFYKENQAQIFSVVPDDAVFILETSDLFEAYKQLVNSEIWQYLTTTSYFSDIAGDLQEVDKYLQATSLPESFFENRTMLISAHVINGDKVGFLFSVDLQGFAKVFKTLKGSLSYVDGYRTIVETYKNSNKRKFEIVGFMEEQAPDNVLYLSFINDVLILSYDKELLIAALESQGNTMLQHCEKVQVSSLYQLQKLFRLYINFSKLDDFLYSFQTSKDPVVDLLSQMLTYAVLDLSYKGPAIELVGDVAFDSTNVYSHVLKAVEPAHAESYKIMSDQTAVYVSVNFKSFKRFYDELMLQYQQMEPQEYEKIQASARMMDKVFGINVEKDIFSWLGNEIAVFKLAPVGLKRKAEDVVVTLHTRKPQYAKASLDSVVKKINRVTPFKFKTLTYRGYQVSYLGINGMFNVLMGDLLKDLQKPYYTVISDYVVLSNSVEVLERVIDDYVDQYTLADNEAFMSFTSRFAKESNLDIFVRMPYLYATMYEFARKDDREFLQENKELLQSIARIGFQISRQNTTFKLNIGAEYDPGANVEVIMSQLEKQSLESEILKQLDNMDFVVRLPDSVNFDNSVVAFEIETPSGMGKAEGEVRDDKPTGFWRTYYPDGNLYTIQMFDSEGLLQGTVQFFRDNKINEKWAELEVKDGKPDGSYQEYYQGGDLRVKMEFKNGKPDGQVYFYYKGKKVKLAGKYKDGKKHGKWIYYDKEGNVVASEKWKNGQRKK